MSSLSLLILIIVFSLFYLYIIKSLKDNTITMDLLFFLFVGIILSFTLCVFYFYFNDLTISAIISFILMINNFLTIREIKHINKKYIIVSILYFIYSVYIFSYVLLKLL